MLITVFFLSSQKGVAAAVQKAAMVALESENLPVHEVTVESDTLDTLGVCFTRGGARPTFRRVHRLRQAVVAMASSPFMPSKQIEIVLGHMTYCLLLGRPGLSVFKNAYTLVSS